MPGDFEAILCFLKRQGLALELLIGKKRFLKPLPKGGFWQGFFMGHLGAMVGPFEGLCQEIWRQKFKP